MSSRGAAAAAPPPVCPSADAPAVPRSQPSSSPPPIPRPPAWETPGRSAAAQRPPVARAPRRPHPRPPPRPPPVANRQAGPEIRPYLTSRNLCPQRNNHRQSSLAPLDYHGTGTGPPRIPPGMPTPTPGGVGALLEEVTEPGTPRSNRLPPRLAIASAIFRLPSHHRGALGEDDDGRGPGQGGVWRARGSSPGSSGWTCGGSSGDDDRAAEGDLAHLVPVVIDGAPNMKSPPQASRKWDFYADAPANGVLGLLASARLRAYARPPATLRRPGPNSRRAAANVLT